MDVNGDVSIVVIRVTSVLRAVAFANFRPVIGCGFRRLAKNFFRLIVEQIDCEVLNLDGVRGLDRLLSSMVTLARPRRSLPTVLSFLSRRLWRLLFVLAIVNASHAFLLLCQIRRTDNIRLIKISASNIVLTFWPSMLRNCFVGSCSRLILVPHLGLGLKADECVMSIIAVHFFFLLSAYHGLCSLVRLSLEVDLSCTRLPVCRF